MSLFEESSRVPLIITAPGRTKAGGVARTPVSHVDLYPTLAGLCNIPAPANLQGQDLAPILADPSVPGRGWALTQVTRGGGPRATASSPKNAAGGRFFGYTLRTARWRYTEWDEGRRGRELYDHDTDPMEQTNLAAEPAHAATVAELATKLRDAVTASLPADGRTPEVREGLWAPSMADP
jgi:iduronate 2-sulfatase